NLVGAETELVSVVGREIILREAMHASEDRFDFCLIDCAPSLGLLSLNALAAAQEVLIPLQPHFLALQGFGKLLQTVDLVSKRINRDLKVTGVLLCMFDTRASLPNEVRADIERFLNNARGSASAWADAQLLPTYIRRNIKLAEAPSYGRTIFEYDPTCNGAEDYKRVGQFFLGIQPEPEAQSARVNSHSPLPAEPESVETQDVTSGSTPESAPEGNPVETPHLASPPASDTEPESTPEPIVEAEPQAAMDAPAETQHLESLPAPRPEPVVEPVEAQHAASLPSDDGLPGGAAEVSHDPECEGLQLPPVADAEAAVAAEPSAETQPLASEPESVSPEGEPQAEADEAHQAPAPIQIREIYPPGPRRYTPPPLQRYPIGPSNGAQRDSDVPRDTPGSPDEHEQGES
ncbi:MAG: AAA family ATPase, partial [Phycisphaerae bacterium]|nr:AAA family ATPase [Phycisphaerae bacterium]